MAKKTRKKTRGRKKRNPKAADVIVAIPNRVQKSRMVNVVRKEMPGGREQGPVALVPVDRSAVVSPKWRKA